MADLDNGLAQVLSGGFSAQAFWESARRAKLARRFSYFRGTQHDAKSWDFDGRMISSGEQSAISVATMQSSPQYVPLRMRRPSAPYRLARTIVKSFTAMLFGEHRFPVLAATDPTTKDFAGALKDAANLPSRIQRVRDLGGATGTWCGSWAFVDGRPRLKAHNARDVTVMTWEDRDEMRPRWVVECYQFDKPVMDPERRRARMVPHWFRRDWTPDADIAFYPVPVRGREEPEWVPDESRSFLHSDGLTHFAMAQNLPEDDDVDGSPDYEGLYENFDSLDVMLSVIVRGAVLNLDPTLKLKMDPDLVNRMGVRKGSDNALVTGEEGDAEYMELAGTSIEAGTKLFNEKRKLALEGARCVIPDPDEVAASGTSSVAIKAIYKPMTDCTDGMRDTGTAFLRSCLEPWLAVSRHRHNRVITVPVPDPTDEDSGRMVEKEFVEVIDLPPRTVPAPELPPGLDGLPATREVPREPGTSETVDPQWGEYFLPTPKDQSDAVTTFTTAAGGPGTKILSQRTATRMTAEVLGLNGDEELQQLEKEQGEAEGKRAEMFAATAQGASSTTRKMSLPDGSSVQHTHDAPPPPEPPQIHVGAPPGIGAPDAKGEDTKETIPLTPSAWSAVVSINEARKSVGLSPLEGDDGMLSVAQYQAKYAAPIAAATNAEQGMVGAKPANESTPPPGAAGLGGPPKPPGTPPAGPPKPPGAAGPPKPPLPPPPVPPFTKK